MATIIRASDVEEAVSIATQLRDEGRYDWFRGQVRNYPVVASLQRLSEAARDEAIQKSARFESWTHRTPGLGELAGSGIDAILAVAQHYGLPTPFVDFTTEPQVAGFFACDAADLVEGEKSCLICVDTRDLLRFWEGLPSGFPPPECLSIDVPNLWRLQAQHGVFLFCPYQNIETIYDFDRIIFPAARRADAAARARMYPPRKSQLEILLDQYFLNERLLEGDRNLKSMNWQMTTVNLDEINPGGIDSEAVDPRIPALPSWTSERLSQWTSTYDERFADVQRRTVIRLMIDPAAAPRSVAEQVTAEVAAQIACGEASRAALVDWRVDLSDPDASPPGLAAVLEAALDWLWDGLRTLPHSDDDLAAGLGNCVGIGLAHEKYSLRYSWNEWTSAAEAVLGSAVEIGMDAEDGSYSHGCAAADSVVSCIRDDIGEFIQPQWRTHLTDHPVGILQVLRVPDRLFEFDRLARLVARELAPTQVLMRTGQPAFFSPARITGIGFS